MVAIKSMKRLFIIHKNSIVPPESVAFVPSSFFHVIWLMVLLRGSRQDFMVVSSRAKGTVYSL
jgi:hypothetical protein